MSNFALDLSKFTNKVKANADQLTRKIVLDVGTELVQRSPVGDPTYWKSPAPLGYVGGRFRANWQHGVNTAPHGEIDKIDKNGGATIGKIQASIPSKAAGLVHYIVNNLPYAKRLEDGWSKQAPAGMVGLTVLKWQGIVDDAARSLK